MKATTGTSSRRMGPPGSATWMAIVEAAEAILREEGYAALTSRTVADRIGIKQRLVYYYFHTMDQLIVETFRCQSTRELARLETALAAPTPLRQLWEICTRSSDARLVSEFMALSNRIEELRIEVIVFIERSRDLQVSALESALRRHPGAAKLPPVALALLLTSVALSINREAELGVSRGHDEIMQAIEHFIATVEPTPG